GFARCLPGSKVNEWLPEIRPAHRETDETFDSSGRCQPLAHLLIIFAATKNDATDSIPSIAVRGGHDLFTVIATIKSLNFPDIRLDARVLHLSDGLNHQPGTKIQVVSFTVSLEPVELHVLRRHKQLKHE